MQAVGLRDTWSLQDVTRKRPEISEYLDFGFYGHVYYKENDGLGMTAIGRWLGVSHRVDKLMSYWIVTQKGTVISRPTFQCLISIENVTYEVKASVSEFDTERSHRFKEEEDLTYDWSKPNPEDWSEYLKYDLDFHEEFDSIINYYNVPEADADFTPYVFEDTYLNMYMEIPIYGVEPEFAKVTKRLRDKDGLPIVIAHNNPILDKRMYEV